MSDRNVRIVERSGKNAHDAYAKVASIAFGKNSLVELGATINPSDDNDTIVFGIIKEEVAATDSDYASTTEKEVDIIMPGDVIEIDTTAELTVGTSYGISNAYTVDQADEGNDVFTCLKVISSTRARGFMKCLAGESVQ